MFGVNAHTQIARQNSGNVAVTVMTSFHAIPILNDTMVPTVSDLISEGMQGRFDEGTSQQGVISAAGDVSFHPHPKLMPLFFYGVTGTISSTAATSAWQHVHIPVQTQFDDNLSLVPWTIESFKDGYNAYQFTDCQMSRLVVEIAGGQLLRSTAGFLSRVASEKAETTPTYLSGDEFTWAQTSVSLGGAAFPNFETLTFTFENQLEMVNLLNGAQNPTRIVRNGYRQCRVAGTLDIPVNSAYGLYPDFFAGTQRQLIVTVQGGSWVSSGINKLSVKIDVPSFKFTSWPAAVNGPGRVTVGFEGRALYNAGSATLYAITCVNTQQSY